jgi:cell division protein FtsZ
MADEFNRGARLKVVGVGGCGGNAIDTMIDAGLRGVDFLSANTDSQALGMSKAGVKLQLGVDLTKGLGAGANPEIGRQSAMESRGKIIEALKDSDMVFITAGMGGGTGTGAAPVIAEAAKECGALVVAVVTKPFAFEGPKKMKQAEEGLKSLRDVVDTVITIPNQRLLGISGKNTTLKDAFKKADEVLYQAVRGISDVITVTGLVNVDFADVRTVMGEMGQAIMGSGSARGDNRGAEAARQAISSPLLEDISINGARGVLINITGSSELTMHDLHEASSLIQEEAHEDATIIFGAVFDESLGDEVRVTVIATGFGKAPEVKGYQPRATTIPKAHVIENLDLPLQGRHEAESAPISQTPMYGAPQAQAPLRELNPRELKRVSNMGGYNHIDEDTRYETPTFLRKQAD